MITRDKNSEISGETLKPRLQFESSYTTIRELLVCYFELLEAERVTKLKLHMEQNVQSSSLYIIT